MAYLFDTTEAVVAYFKANMETLVGKGGVEIGVYRDIFPSDADSTGVSVFEEVSGEPKYDGIMDVGVRINVRAPGKKDSYNLIRNVDLLLNMMVRKALTDDVELVLCTRNSGPSWFPGQDELHYYTALYESTMRQTN